MSQLIAGKKWDNPISNTIDLLYQLISIGLGSFTNYKGWQHFRYRVKTSPDPGITIVSKDLLYGSEVFLLFFTKLQSSSS